MEPNTSPKQIATEYREVTKDMNRYLKWLEGKSGQTMVKNYSGSDIGAHSMVFPVFDSTLLSFVKSVDNSGILNRNYKYDYVKYHIKNASDEMRFIEGADIHDLSVLASIMSHYIIGGRTKPALWNEGLKNGMYLAILKKINELAQFWDPIF